MTIATATLVDNVELMNKKRKENALAMLNKVNFHIFKSKLVIRDINDRNHYAVMASSGGLYYEVMFLQSGKYCSCMDYVQKGHIQGFKCKHIQAIEILKEQKKRLPKGVLKL